jgi:hypothetical protein
MAQVCLKRALSCTLGRRWRPATGTPSACICRWLLLQRGSRGCGCGRSAAQPCTTIEWLHGRVRSRPCRMGHARLQLHRRQRSGGCTCLWQFNTLASCLSIPNSGTANHCDNQTRSCKGTRRKLSCMQGLMPSAQSWPGRHCCHIALQIEGQWAARIIVFSAQTFSAVRSPAQLSRPILTALAA